MPITRVRKYRFKPLKEYAGLTASALAEEWLKTRPDNLQRVFIYQAIRKTPNFFFKLDEKEQRQINLRNRKEQKRFKLQDDEVLVYCLDDMIHHVLGYITFVSLSIFPFVFLLITSQLVEKTSFTHNFLLVVWLPSYCIIRTLKIFQSKIFITNLRIGCCLTILWRFNCFFYFLEFVNKVVSANFEAVLKDSTKIKFAGKQSNRNFGIYRPNNILVSIWQINNDVRRSYRFNQFSMISFLECLIVLIKENGGIIYIPKFVELGEQANGTMGVVYSHQFTGSDLNALKEWYTKVKRVMVSKTLTSNPQLKMISEIANYFDPKQVHDVQSEYNELKSQIDEKLTFITKMQVGFYYTRSLDGYLCFTDKGLILSDKHLKSIKNFYRYPDIKLKRLPHSVKLYSRHAFFCLIDFRNIARFPVIETLSLLGCSMPE